MDKSINFNPKISVIVPAYNIEEYIGECLESLINQTYHNLEIIVVNDGSKDNTLKIIEKYASEDNRLIVINKPNGGLSSARNAGLDIMSGDYVSFIDGDDFVSIHLYDSIVRIISDNMDLDLIQYGYCEFINGGGIKDQSSKDVNKNNANKELSFFYGADILDNIIVKNSPLSVLVWDKIYKKEIFRKVRFCDGKYYEDLPVSLEILFYANKIVVTRQTFYNYRKMRIGAITNEKDEKILDEYYIIETLIKKYKHNSYLLGIIETYSIDRLLFWYVRVTNNRIPFKNRKYIIDKLHEYIKGKRKIPIKCPFGIKYIKYKIFLYLPNVYRFINKIIRKIKS